MLSYVQYTPRYLRISTLTGVSNTNFVMLMTSSTIVYVRYKHLFAFFMLIVHVNVIIRKLLENYYELKCISTLITVSPS
jgi:hypothetical protein